MGEEISQVKKNFLESLQKVSNLDELESLKIKYLGRQGVVNALLARLKLLGVDEKKTAGIILNAFKFFTADNIKKRSDELLSEFEEKEQIDVTLPGEKRKIGSLHLVSEAIEEIVNIFTRLGFIRLSYMEVEREYFAFDALNMPPGHPARDDFETFFIDGPEDKKYGKIVLTPHTSNGQVREMLRQKGRPPIKMINIGKCYRPNLDTSHTPMFHQFEGLCIDRNINIANLKGTIEFFAKEFFGQRRKIRLRPFHFQFTEPSFEVDITCDFCKGRGEINGKACKLCKAGWLELGGAGMVHPNVLKAGRVDPEKYTGWALGFGIERAAIMKEGLNLPDIRILYSGDIRFLEQF